MKGLIKKSFLLGIGAASLTRKKANKAVKAMAKKGLVRANEVNAVVNEMLKEANLYRKELEKIGEKEVKKALKVAGIKSVGEIKRLKQKVMALEKLLRREAKKAAIKAIRSI